MTATSPGEPAARIPLVIDTDTAADDCFALLVGLIDPRADLRAVTIVAGNVGFDQQVHNALLTMQLAGRRSPVFTGARRPLERDWVDAVDVHGDGVGGLRLAGPAEPDGDDAVGELIRLSREHDGELVVVAIGPLTNLALAVRRDPEFAHRVRRLLVMGGSVNARGNITPAAEYNVYVDPEAADTVVRAGFPDVVIVSWDPLTLRDAVFDAARIERIAELDTELARFFVRANAATFAFDAAAGLGGSTHPDSLTAALALDPSLALETRRYRLDVETAGELTRGATVFDWRADDPNVTVVERADGERFYAHLRGLLASR
ncbi:nucleoside hydrolase [Galbitalea sp. SE-J8]|uniref:nucleoside hydrolase n=1 Tax=Galbitalea sp. SE-J8 TaxID=3054952 RepID=UPI00259C9833|nr:nucleoside hydrolase [Galbitalea sp. SE-J8]MDM4764072.1 nucleoside hydrolase [Galbitalea sp. SE-J8]